ncbi:methylthioribose-1-phosphate isomerase [Alicyclobacillus cellulosilyticus]|uniref:Methylthioribose-1-phosphate isomerase n=1 Tax=Alicyclobacillus cellulosilyticus TaxID=1003997 RepID=A0A917NLS2_9BACL|nr:S-methyl-5-thioribose-1-phosphate isomerase [Alicyclobacillus cellulosilyticus]GGJ07309.1 methylthioribose-1-phosphate isomerase [Alicyclobacillus cellulosilyticus]
MLQPLIWTGHSLRVLDQRRLPNETVWSEYRDAAGVAEAIRSMQVRGAPAIAAAAAYGLAMEAQRHAGARGDRLPEVLEAAARVLLASRPTAVNLRWAVERMQKAAAACPDPAALPQVLVAEAERIAAEDVAVNRRIGDLGAALFARPVQVLTHCNTGALATAGYGTALGVVRRLHELGRLRQVLVDETRPYWQGARLTAYELAAEGIPHILITDSMAGHFMQRGQVDAVLVGADRIARNGDVANKIGTYTLAVLCRHHGIPFYVAAPVSTFDLTIATGEDIPIEERDPAEVTHVYGRRITPEGTQAAHPAFDVTPHELVTAIITERGVIHHPQPESVRAVLAAEDKTRAEGSTPA